MNIEWTEKLFNSIPSDQLSKILRNDKIKYRIRGFRSPDLAPLTILKNTLKNNKMFASQFLDAVIDESNCSSEQHADEEHVSKGTHDNFWGLFAQKCKNLDDSPDACKELEGMLSGYERLAIPDLLNDEDNMATAPVGSDYKVTENSEVNNKTNEALSFGYVDLEENHMSESTQYIGYIQETKGYYNFYPLYVFSDGTAEPFHERREQFPELGNINLSNTYWDYDDKGKCVDGEILVISLSRSDLIDNMRHDGYPQKTNFKVDFSQLKRQGRIKRLKDIRMYPVLHPVGIIDFTKKTIPVKEKYVNTKDLCLIEESKILYGPYSISLDGSGQILINITANNYVVDSYRPENGEISSIDIGMDRSGEACRVVCLDKGFIHQSVDKITDQDLLKFFHCSLSGLKDSQMLHAVLDMTDDYGASVFRGLSKDLATDRVQRVKTLLKDRIEQDEAQEDVAKFVADLLCKFGNADYFSSLLEKILDNSNLAQKIQSFKITEERLFGMRKQYEELKRDHDHEMQKLEEEKKNTQISMLTDNANDEIRKLNEQKRELEQEIVTLKSQKNEWKELSDLEDERKFLTRRNEELRTDEEKLKSEVDKTVRAIQDKFKSVITNKAVDIAFEPRIADQIFQAAAGYNRDNQNKLLKETAKQLIDKHKIPTLSNEYLVDYLLTSVKRYRPNYPQNEILNIFISIAQNFLTVFSGDPGTGKTSICNIVAHILGTSRLSSLVQIDEKEKLELGRYVPISIERGWTSKRDFIGYYNPLSQSFEPANKHLYDGLRLLDVEGENSIYPYIVLLDEANLSQIEYYWADFMNICDSNSHFNKITLGNDVQLKIPHTLRFVATINNDDTTERLSPRLIDRATLICLPNVPCTKVDDEELKDTSFVKVVKWSALQEIFAPSANTSLDLDAMPQGIYKDICDLFRENMKSSVSPRIDTIIRRYWVTAKELFESEGGNDTTIVALDYAVAQKLLPKINGSGDVYCNFLNKFRDLCEKNNLEKSRTMLENIIKRGKESMNYFQYF